MATGGQEIPEPVDGNRRIENFMKLSFLFINVGGSALRQLLQQLITDDPDWGNLQFYEFLNICAVRCKLFHLRKKYDCCQCKSTEFSNKLQDEQWGTLYKMLDEPTCTRNYTNMDNHCCVHRAVIGVLDNIDITLMTCILKNVFDSKLTNHLKGLLRRVKDMRNKLFHLPNTQISDDYFEFIWRDSSKTLKELAKQFRDHRKWNEVKSQIDEIRTMEIQQQSSEIVNSYAINNRVVENTSDVIRNGAFSELQQLHLSGENGQEAVEDINETIAQLEIKLEELKSEASTRSKRTT